MAETVLSGLRRLRAVMRPWARPALAASGAVAASLAGLLLLSFAWALATLPLPGGFEEAGRGAVAIRAADGSLLAWRGVARGGQVVPSALPPHVTRAVLAMEDRRFHAHGGIDLAGILRAAVQNVTAGEVRQGGSTITQQLAKTLFLTPERTFTRKLQEVLLAYWLERRMTKDEILGRYLETVYLGAGAHGLPAAARRYFGKDAKDLTLPEAAMLAGLIQAPSRYAPTRSVETARERASVALAAMADAGFITREQAEQARRQPATLALAPGDLPGAGHFADWVDGQARRLLGGAGGTAELETTLDPRLQELAGAVVARALDGEGREKGVGEAALVALRADGAVVAMVGGRDYDSSSFNRAVQARRQPGSLFKLFVYLAALESGMRPDDRVEDAPLRIGEWEPRNLDGKFRGAVPLREAFAQSLNVATVAVQERVGRGRVAALARSMGVPAEEVGPALALGTVEASLLEITAAYAAVAAGTERVEPYGIRALRGPGALGWVRPPPAARRAAWPRETMLDLLGAVVRTGTGRAAALRVPAYGKTGTTQENRDAWFVGFAGDLVVGVWVGNDDGRPMDRVTGGGLPARLWAAFMGGALAAVPPTLVAETPAPAPVAEPPLPEPPVPELPKAQPLPEAPPPKPAPVRRPVIGVPLVIDTGTLRLAGREIRLIGVEPLAGPQARAFAAYIGGREVACTPVTGDLHRCEVDGWDLSEAVLFNGGGRATRDAPPALLAAEERARADRKGVWGGR